MMMAAPAIDTTLAALRMHAATHGAGGYAQSADNGLAKLDDNSWHRLIAFASAHFVLQALAGPLEKVVCSEQGRADALTFLDAVHESNKERNVLLQHTLLDVAGALNAIGTVPCALKGAAIILTDDKAGAAPWRFMSDLDLLVPEDSLSGCVECLRGLGFAPATETYDPQVEAHYPPLISPCRTFSIELHTRLFGLDDYGLSPQAVLAEAQALPQAGPTILIPSMRHRIAHLLIHAQLHNRNYAIHRIVLKDVLDLIVLMGADFTPADLSEVLGSFRKQEQRAAVEGLLVVWQRCTSASIGTDFSPAAQAWADRAIRRLYWPRWRTLLNLPGDVLRMESHRYRTENGHVQRRFQLLSDPSRILNASANWIGKQRQRVWG